MGSILYIKQCPPNGGDTLFANMYAAYDALSERLKTYLAGLRAIHDGEHVYRGLFDSVADKPSYPRAEHPVVRTHPDTGKKALYVNRGFTTSRSKKAARWTFATNGYKIDHDRGCSSYLGGSSCRILCGPRMVLGWWTVLTRT